MRGRTVVAVLVLALTGLCAAAATAAAEEYLEVLAFCRSVATTAAYVRCGTTRFLVEPEWLSPDGYVQVKTIARAGLTVLLRTSGRSVFVPAPSTWATVPPSWTGVVGAAAIEMAGEQLDLAEAMQLLARTTNSNLYVHRDVAGVMPVSLLAATPEMAANILVLRANHGLAQLQYASPPNPPVGGRTFFVVPRGPAQVGIADIPGWPPSSSIILRNTGLDVRDALQLIARQAKINVVFGPTVQGTCRIEALNEPTMVVAQLLAAAFDAQVHGAPDVPNTFLIAPFGFDDVVFDLDPDAVAEENRRPMTLKSRSLPVVDTLQMVARAAGIRLVVPTALHTTMAVELRGLSPRDTLRVVAAAARLDVRPSTTAGTYEVTETAVQGH